VESEEKKLTLPSLKREDPRLEEIPRHVVIEVLLGGTHRVLEQPRLAAERPLQDHTQAIAKLFLLTFGEMTIINSAEDLTERHQITEKSAERVDVLNEPPQLHEIVLHRRRGEEQHGCAAGHQQFAKATSSLRLRRIVPVLTELVEALVDAGEDFVGLIDDAEVKRIGEEERVTSLHTTGGFASDEEHAVSIEPSDSRLGFDRVNVEQLVQLLTPLPKEWLGSDEKNAACSLRNELGHDESSFDCLSEADLICEDASALAETAKSKDHRVDLMRVGVHPCGALRGGVTTSLIGAPKAHEVLRLVPALRRVKTDLPFRNHAVVDVSMTEALSLTKESRMTKADLIDAVMAEMSRVWGQEGLGGEKREYEWLLQTYGITEEEDVQWQLILQDDMDDLPEEDLEDGELMTFLADQPAVVTFLISVYRSR